MRWVVYMTFHLNVSFSELGVESWPSLPSIFPRSSVNVCWLSYWMLVRRPHRMRSKRAENENGGKKNQLTKENDCKKENTEPPSGVNHFYPKPYSFVYTQQTSGIALNWELPRPLTFPFLWVLAMEHFEKPFHWSFWFGSHNIFMKWSIWVYHHCFCIDEETIPQRS